MKTFYAKNKYLPVYLILPLLFTLLVVNLYPTIYQIYISLTSYTLAGSTIEFIGLSNYIQLLYDNRFWNSILVIIKFLLYTIPLEVILGMFIALLLYECEYRRYFIPLLLLPVTTTPIVVGYIFQYMYRQDYGIISYVLKVLRIFPGYNLTANPNTVIPAIAIIDIWEWTPFVMLILLAGLQSLPPSIYEAAKVDGASSIQLLKWITIPLLKNQIFIVLIFRTVEIIRLFDIIFSTTRGGPGIASESTSIYLQLLAFRFRELGKGAALSMLLMFIGLFFATLYLRILKNQMIEQK